MQNIPHSEFLRSFVHMLRNDIATMNIEQAERSLDLLQGYLSTAHVFHLDDLTSHDNDQVRRGAIAIHKALHQQPAINN